MSGANSAPVFEQRAGELGIPGELVDALKGAHVNSFARLAYLTPYQPGQPDDQVLFDKLGDIAGRALQDFEKACFRQLFYEASAITVSELKQKVERVESSEPATLPLAERLHRMENQKTNLTGVHFSVFTEPSNKLVDQYFQMMTDQQLTWLPWSKLASRSDELQLSKKDLQLVFDSQGNLKMSKKETEAHSDLKGEIQIRQALRRRSLAVDLTGLIDFQTMETWHEKMFECLAKQAPSGYRQTSMEQCKEADKMLWTMLAERTRDNVKVTAADKPVQVAFIALTLSTEVLLLLQPLPAPQTRPGPYDRTPTNDAKGDGKGKGKNDKGKGKAKISLPENCTAKTPEGKPICFNFNYGRCRRAQAGKRCDRGYHVCFRCYSNKPHCECTHDN